jgi:hypothetical protein
MTRHRMGETAWGGVEPSGHFLQQAATVLPSSTQAGQEVKSMTRTQAALNDLLYEISWFGFKLNITYNATSGFVRV